MSNNELTSKICNRITDYVMSNELSNNDLVQIIEHVGGFLNLCTRSEYSRRTGISYNGAKKHRQNIQLFNQIFIIDND